MKLDIFFDDGEININRNFEEIIKKNILGTLKYFDFHDNTEISVSFVDKDEITELNKKFRKIEKETDVLSFPLLNEHQIESAFANGEKVFLGDIVICFDKAKEQAKEYNHSLEREISFLTVHSMLHLLGYDHLTEEEEKNMFELQEIILNQNGFAREAL